MSIAGRQSAGADRPSRSPKSAAMIRAAVFRPIAALALVLPLVGCESTPRPAGLDHSLLEYEAGAYGSAYTAAGEAMRNTAGAEREQATYVAGLCAYRLGRLDEAERHLLTASRSSDASVAAKAKAQIALIRLDQDRPEEAVRLLGAAAEDLDGTDCHHARRYADAAGRLADAAPHRAPAPIESVIARSPSRDVPSGFTLQVGAFKDRTGAERAAASARRLARDHGLGEVWIIPRRGETGRLLYLVHLGSFATRSEAATARRQLRQPDYLITPHAGAATG